MQRTKWKPTKELLEKIQDGYINIDTLEKHCGNCRFGMINDDGYKRYKKSGKWDDIKNAGCKHRAKLIKEGGDYLIQLTCSGIIRRYSKRIGLEIF